mmetsp:Transcript_33663/g.47841  ORF Transcript_33663/g.47841 Transcript_33663/m.47841 type:complete len:92 (-) Transcript_33663:2240-2515(-)
MNTGAIFVGTPATGEGATVVVGYNDGRPDGKSEGVIEGKDDGAVSSTNDEGAEVLDVFCPRPDGELDTEGSWAGAIGSEDGLLELEGADVL